MPPLLIPFVPQQTAQTALDDALLLFLSITSDAGIHIGRFQLVLRASAVTEWINNALPTAFAAIAQLPTLLIALIVLNSAVLRHDAFCQFRQNSRAVHLYILPS